MKRRFKRRRRSYTDYSAKKKEGILSLHRDGYGFVKVEDEKGKDYFVPRSKLKGAMDGDIVRLEVRRDFRTGNEEGAVLEVLERRRKEVVGFYDGRYIVPRDNKLHFRFFVEGDRTGSAFAGAIVVGRIKNYPDRSGRCTAEIVEVLGDENDKEVESRAVLYEHGFRDEFPFSVQDELGDIPSRVKDSEIKGRVDLRKRRIFTIDPKTARDFDDAVGIEKLKDGYRLFVCIADVAHYVNSGSAIDDEAYFRGTSVYFPHRAFPMLPEKLSSEICSLKPNEDRLVMTVEINYDKKGARKYVKFYPAIFRSSFRLNYEEAYSLMLGEDKELASKYAPILDDIKYMEELSYLLGNFGARKGRLDLDLPEAEVIFDNGGIIKDIRKAERNIAHRMIEHFMIEANEAVALYLTENGQALIYRVHEPPSPEKIEELERLLSRMGLHLARSGQSKIVARNFQKILRKAEKRADFQLVNYLVLRAMMQAKYSPKNLGHFGLASDCYCHFTSPIRRYPDLVVHRILKRALDPKSIKGSIAPSTLEVTSEHCSQRERDAEEAEREMVRFYQAKFLSEKIGENFDGMISGITNFGFFVELNRPFAEGLVPSWSIDDYVYDEMNLCARFLYKNKRIELKIADRVCVQLESVNIKERQIIFRFLKPC